MTMSSQDALKVQCPCCRATLTVDPDSGEVLMHQEAKVKGPVTDLTQAVQNLKKGAGQREEIFKKSMDAEKHKGDILKKKFDEAFKRAKEDPDSPPPLREIDLG
jgi:hypothetical protein